MPFCPMIVVVGGVVQVTVVEVKLAGDGGGGEERSKKGSRGKGNMEGDDNEEVWQVGGHAF